MDERTVNKIERHEGSHVSEVYIAVNGRSTNIHPDIFFVNGFEDFLFAGKRVV